MLSTDLSEALRTRIKERRTVVKQKLLKKDIRKNLKRISKDNNSNDNVALVEEVLEKNEDSQLKKKDLTLQEELQLQIKQEVASSYTIQTKKPKDFDKILKKEVTAFESERVRG